MTKAHDAGWACLAMIHGIGAVALIAGSYCFDPEVFTYLAPVAFGQLILLNIWFALSTSNFRFRLMLLLPTGLVLQAINFNPSQWTEFRPLLLLSLSSVFWTFFVVAVPILVGIAFGWRPNAHSKTPWQVSSGTLLALTAAVVLVLVLRKLIQEMGMPQSDGAVGIPNTPYSVLLSFAVIVGSIVGMVAAVLSAVWSCLGNITRLPACFLIVAIVCAFPLHSTGGESHAAWARMFATTMIVVILSLLFVRYSTLRSGFTNTASIPRAA